jgi:uncharacterized protein with von Willebrand factor type A (vWA) domain
MERLSRLSHKVVWVNPHDRPRNLGMLVAAPHIDRLLRGQDLRDLERLASLLPTL